MLTMWKSKIRCKMRDTIILIVVSTVAVSLTAMYPVENLFITYPSPESVFHYTNTGHIEAILAGDNSCLVVYSKDAETFGNYVIPKSADGYKIPTYRATKKVFGRFDSNGVFDVYHIRGTTDYYVVGMVHLNSNTDNEIHLLNAQGNIVDTSIVQTADNDFVYFYLPDFSKEYVLSINGKIVYIFE